MANITHDSPVVTEDKLKDFYEDIKPFLGCPAYVTQEGDSEYYSTDEKVIGRWVDGKPLYQKTIKNTSLTVIAKSTWTTYANISNLHIDSLVNTSFGRLTSSGKKEDDMSDVCFWTDGTILQANSRGEGTSTPNGSVVTIKYTKTTDSAATTIEEKHTHYSTDEQVVGKWVDDKPIYQKTIRFSFPYGTNSYNIATLSNIDTMINLTGYINEDGTYFNINNFNCRLQYISSTGLLQWRAISSSTWGASVCQATIQYTKTTD